MRNEYKILVLSLCIKLDRHIRGCEVVKWIRLAQNLIEWQALVNRVMNLNVTHKAENYDDVSGSKWQINALTAQRLWVYMWLFLEKLLLTARIFENFYLHTCLYTQIYMVMECSLKKSKEQFYISNPAWVSLRWCSPTHCSFWETVNTICYRQNRTSKCRSKYR